MEHEVETEVNVISDWLNTSGITYERIGIESGQLSLSLCKGLTAHGYPVLYVDARHMAAALSARVNKNDKNDANGIAQACCSMSTS